MRCPESAQDRQYTRHLRYAAVRQQQGCLPATEMQQGCLPAKEMQQGGLPAKEMRRGHAKKMRLLTLIVMVIVIVLVAVEVASQCQRDFSTVDRS